MIAADTSTWVAFLQGESGADVEMLVLALRDDMLLMPPVVLTELISETSGQREHAATLAEVRLIDPDPGFWRRTGKLRARVLAAGRRARLGDALIAQSCLDRKIPLITRDADFQAFAAASGLKLLPPQER